MNLFKLWFGKVDKSPAQLDAAVAAVQASADMHTPSYSVRIASYDSLTSLPRTFDLSGSDFSLIVEDACSKVYSLCREKGGNVPYIVLREALENLIHADFCDAVVTVLPDGNTVRISDHGPGIGDKQRALLPGFTTASERTRQYIKGVGSGLPIMRESMELMGGMVILEDNLGRGCVVTITSSSPFADRQHASVPAGAAGAAGAPQAPGASARPVELASPSAAGGAVPSGSPEGSTLPIPHADAGDAFAGYRAGGAALAAATSATTAVAATASVAAAGTGAGTRAGSAPSAAQRYVAAQAESSEASLSAELSKPSADMLNAGKQEVGAGQSKSNSPDVSQLTDEAIDNALSSRQKKVFLLIAEMGEIGPSVVTKELDISLSTAYRDLVTLEELNLVVSLDGGKRKLTRRGIDFLGHIFR